MSCWTGLRNAVETGGSLVGNYLLPGSSHITDQLVSKGSQQQLSSPIGRLAQVGTALAGGAAGNLSNYGALTDATGITSGTTPFNYGALSGPAASMRLPGSVAPATVDASATGGNLGATIGGDTAAGGVVAPPPSADTGMQWNPSTGNFEKVAGAAKTGGGLSDMLSGMTTQQKMALGLSGINTLGAMTGAGKAPISTDPYGTGAAAGAASTALLNKYNTGQLMPADQSGIAQWHQQSVAAAQDYYQKAGLADSSMAQQAIAQIGQQADQMRQSALNNMLTQAQSAAGIASPFVNSMVKQQVDQNAQLQAAQSDFASLMMQYGMYSGGTTKAGA